MQDEKDSEYAADKRDGWSNVDEPPLLMPFTGSPGLPSTVSAESPLDFFFLLFEEDMFDVMVRETNRYANSKKDSSTLKPFSRLHKWEDTSVEEMKVFIALIIDMGLVRKTDIEEYWSAEEVIATPFFSKMMSRDRFLALLSNLHIVDNATSKPATDPSRDRLFKIRPLVSMLRRTFSVYTPEQDLSFDEGTCPFKGRVHFKVYNPNKPHKFGMKSYQLCESSSGYCCGFDLYHGDTDTAKYVDALNTGEEDSYDDLTTTSKVVLGILAQTGLLNQGYHIYMDNYYTSPELFEELNALDTYACGTLRVNRKGVPEALKAKTLKLKQGNGIFRRKENLLAIKFKDKRDIHMLSTIHGARLGVIERREKVTAKPTAIIDYVKKMGGVDVSDQIIQYYTILRKTVKWWKKMFFHLLSLALVNSYILHQKFGSSPSLRKKRSHKEFVIALIKELIRDAPNAPKPKQAGRKPSMESLERLTGHHFARRIQAKAGAKRKNPVRDCVVCNPAKEKRAGFKRKQSAYECEQCQKPMCFPDCFKLYHTKKDIRSGGRDQSPHDTDSD